MKLLRALRAQSLAYPGETRTFRYVKFRDVRDKMRQLRKMADAGAMDPRVREVAVEIIRSAGAAPRDYQAQASAILSWVQENMYYVGEGLEQFQSAIYSLMHGFGDCDDSNPILLAALLESIKLPTLIECVGWPDYHGGPNVWRHVYVLVGLPPRAPVWYPCEGTLKVPLGFDPAEYARSNLERAAGAF